jgi:lysophospholipase L1-like esterase
VRTKILEKRNIRFLALGDSYTVGESVLPAASWPVQLTVALSERGYAVADPLIVARTGWTTDELTAGIQEAAPSGPFELVSLQIGVNNQYRQGDLETYRTEFHLLLADAVAFAGGETGKVFVLSIPDWSVTPFAEGRDRDAISAQIDAFNRANRLETEHLGARYVDVTPLSRLAEFDTDLLAPDGLHPSGAMYKAWVGLILPQATAALAALKQEFS